jgi:hypothetical protein
MKRSRFCQLAGWPTLLFAAASPAVAQFGSHSGISTERTYAGRGAYDDLNAFGQCYALKQTKEQKVQIDTILLRYRIAEAMWRLGMVHS